MSVGPMSLGLIGSIATSPTAQKNGDVENSQHQVSAQQMKAESASRAEKAAGVGTTEHQENASDRDADGRLPWMIGGHANQEESSDAGPKAGGSKDPTGATGGQLDLSG